MNTLVVFAVIGVCYASASYQANNYGNFGSHHGGGSSYGYVQPRWTGPVAATVPAGVNGKIIPVSDTYEVAAARNDFFRAYDNQLATINSIRHQTGSYGSYGPVHSGPIHSGPVHSGPVHSGPVHSTAQVYSAPRSYGNAGHSYAAPLAPGQDTPEVAAAKAQHFQLFRQQAAAAAAAPDVYTHSRPTYHRGY